MSADTLEILYHFQVTKLPRVEVCEPPGDESCATPAAYKILLITPKMYGHNSVCEAPLRQLAPEVDLQP